MTIATIALAAGLATAKPINAPQSLPGYTKRSNNVFGEGFNGAIVNGNRGEGFNFIDGFNNFNQQQQVIQIQEQNLQIVDNGFQQQVVQQVQEVLIVDQVNNGFNNDLNNLFRASNFRNQFQDVSTVMLVVQEIQIAVDDGRGNQFQQNVFAQSALVANRGARKSQTIMVFDSKTLVAQDILGNNAFQNIGQFGGIAGATGDLNRDLPTKTAGIQLFGAKPTWSAVAEDPAANLGGIWQAALEDLQRADNDQQDNQLNDQIAAEEKKALDEARNNENNNNNEEEQKAAEQQAAEQAAAEQAAAEQAAAEQQQQGEGNAEEQQAAAEQQAAEQKQGEQKQGEQKAEKKE